MNAKLWGPACALQALSLLVSPATAAVVGGGVTGGTSGGAFSVISPPAVAGPDAFESPDLIAFDERQGFVLPAPVPVGPGVILGSGSVVSSHYVAFDPADPSTLEGFVDFDEPIIGLAAGPAALNGTTPIFGVPTTSYSVAPAIGPDVPADAFQVSPTMPNRLLVRFGASSPGDQLRVLTGVAVPEPTALVVIMLGAAGVVAGMRR